MFWTEMTCWKVSFQTSIFGSPAINLAGNSFCFPVGKWQRISECLGKLEPGAELRICWGVHHFLLHLHGSEMGSLGDRGGWNRLGEFENFRVSSCFVLVRHIYYIYIWLYMYIFTWGVDRLCLEQCLEKSFVWTGSWLREGYCICASMSM